MALAEPASSRTIAGGAPGLGLADDRFARGSILTLRIVMAFLWIQNTRWKLPPDFGADSKAGLYTYVDYAVQYPVFPPFAALAEHVLRPNLAIFGWGVLLAEATIGACLLVGFMTRAVGLIGFVQSLAIFLSVGRAPHELPWSYYLMMVGCLALAGVAAGRVVGLDGVLRPRLLRSEGVLRRAAVLS
ncbi:MAG: TQO small subunit DoxD [Actinobacteria bacterium]|nr:TQO small subunit DoxD [Actinomycetota bacterium]